MVYGKEIDQWLADNPDRHECKLGYGRYHWECFEWFGFDLRLNAEEYEISVQYCPFCGFKSRKK
jgi:hypothetical protein